MYFHDSPFIFRILSLHLLLTILHLFWIIFLRFNAIRPSAFSSPFRSSAHFVVIRFFQCQSIRSIHHCVFGFISCSLFGDGFSCYLPFVVAVRTFHCLIRRSISVHNFTRSHLHLSLLIGSVLCTRVSLHSLVQLQTEIHTHTPRESANPGGVLTFKAMPTLNSQLQQWDVSCTWGEHFLRQSAPTVSYLRMDCQVQRLHNAHMTARSRV